jgi:hypothetical protein
MPCFGVHLWFIIIIFTYTVNTHNNMYPSRISILLTGSFNFLHVSSYNSFSEILLFVTQNSNLQHKLQNPKY